MPEQIGADRASLDLRDQQPDYQERFPWGCGCLLGDGQAELGAITKRWGRASEWIRLLPLGEPQPVQRS
jgi:hypothetical protein